MSAPFAINARGAPFSEAEKSVAAHFRLSLFGIVARIIEACDEPGDARPATQVFPVLADYASEIAARLGRDRWRAADWRAALDLWSATLTVDLPLRALGAAGLDRIEIELLLACGLLEEDARFSDLFERCGGRDGRPTLGLLLAWWRCAEDGSDRPEEARRAVLRLIRLGLLQVANANAPRGDWALTVATPLWDALRGEPPDLPWLRYLRRETAPSTSAYIADAELSRIVQSLPKALAARPEQILLVRGPRRNGRKTLVQAVSAALGKGVLAASGAILDDEPKWRLFGALAAALNATPVIELDLAPGETRGLPVLPLTSGPIAIVAGTAGAVEVADRRPLLTVEIPLPDAACRQRHWRAAAPREEDPAALDRLARSMRLTSGHIRAAADMAAARAALDGRKTMTPDDVRCACRGLAGARLETLATRLDARGSFCDLALDDETRAELESLATRCRRREDLAALDAGGQQSIGVRALFGGPSGVGKSMAARLLAATLGKDLYRVDLSATVNKYLGETEKSLDRVLAAAEELDVVLLLDEGDALMAPRTDVGSSNDRYANLETNFLLQRIETFTGVLIVTSNDVERIDRAFARRMDVVLHFRAPDEFSRYEILRLHLGRHEVDDRWLQEAAFRCILTGGQFRNVVAHARLLSLQDARALDAAHLHAALMREYRKTGAHCPAPPPL